MTTSAMTAPDTRRQLQHVETLRRFLRGDSCFVHDLRGMMDYHDGLSRRQQRAFCHAGRVLTDPEPIQSETEGENKQFTEHTHKVVSFFIKSVFVFPCPVLPKCCQVSVDRSRVPETGGRWL
ncbi:protein UL30 [Human betaherpesvirus 5]|uniref:Protein UL30 n=1 Tax=Human cytomegalovirus (strain Merlin) TaxID=295027 RepID=V9LLR9_HCMVM|nr:protein UL30 [Human betaherpesvirus 5]